MTYASSLRAEFNGALRAITCAALYFVTSAVVIAGMTLGFAQRDPRTHALREAGGLAPFRNWDGVMYKQIADRGYAYQGPRQRASMAFFPAYPLLSRGVKLLASVPADAALLIVSHGCLVGAFVVMGAYCAARQTSLGVAAEWYALLAMGLLPTTFFFRAAYSESLLLVLIALFLYGMARQWPLFALALIAGLATATRGPGVALVAPLVVHAWRRLRDAPAPRSPLVRSTHVATLAVLSCWGLIFFMGYQWFEFGDPLAFAKLQYHWLLRHGEHGSELEKLWSLLTLEPIWAVYVPSKIEYWARYDTRSWPLFSLQFANPIYFVGTIGLVIIGWRKKWLNDYEVLLSAGLLLIPYLTKSYDNAMASFGRFSAVVLPAYLVIGQLLARVPWPLAVAILSISAFFLGVYSALFAAGYRFI